MKFLIGNNQDFGIFGAFYVDKLFIRKITYIHSPKTNTDELWRKDKKEIDLIFFL